MGPFLARPRGVLAAVLLLHAASALSVPVSPQHQRGDFRAGEVLAQVRAAQAESADSATVRNLKEQLSDQIDVIRLEDNTDRQGLPEAKGALQRRISSLQDALEHSEDRLHNFTVAVERKKADCERLSAEKKAAADVMSEALKQSQNHDDLHASEKRQSDASIQALDRDLEILSRIESYLVEQAGGVAVENGLSRSAIQTQVTGLMERLSVELRESKESAEANWRITDERLAVEAEPAREALNQTRGGLAEATRSEERCVAQLGAAEAQEKKYREETIAETRSQLLEAQNTLGSADEQFELRHQAREKRIGFLQGLLEQLAQLADDASAH